MRRHADVSHSQAHKDASWLVPALDVWRNRVLRYANMWSGREDAQVDAAYWHGERASASTLVAALAETGADILCEYDCERVPQDPSVGTRRGRSDIWFRIGRRSAVMEVKQRWPRDPAQQRPLAEAALRDARAQLANSAHQLDASTYLFSAVFLAPRIPLAADPNNDPAQTFTQAANVFLDARRDRNTLRFTASAWAWCFPAIARNLRGILAPNHTYPGTILIIRNESTSARSMEI